MNNWIVVLEHHDGVDLQFLAPWSGDPGRTCCLEKAKKYKSISSATYGLAYARKYRDFKTAYIRQALQEVEK